MDQSVSTLIYPKKPQHYRGESGSIYLRITMKREGEIMLDKKELSTGKSVDLAKWSSQANRIMGRMEQVKVINEYFDILELKASQSLNQPE